MTRSQEQGSSQPQPKNIERLQPDELEQYYSVPGWRIWRESMFSRGAYRKALDRAAAKPMAIMIYPNQRGYYQVWDRYEEKQPNKTPLLFVGSGAFDRPSFLLEPLTEEEVRKVNEQGKPPRSLGSTNKPDELFPLKDFRKIFDPKDTPSST